MTEALGVVVVTRNHERTIGPVLEALAAQTQPAEKTVVVDCGSDHISWMRVWQGRADMEFVALGRNAGFAGGNNEGWRRLGLRTGLVLFLNPDVIMPPRLLERLRVFSKEARAHDLSAWSVRLMRWDFARGAATGEVDSTGLFPHWTGWRDRRGDASSPGDIVEPVPALCGAFFMARVPELHATALSGDAVWDERYLAYKEDVELSLRLRRAGRRIGVWHGAEAWHGRGWASNRREMSREVRLLSARNEVMLHREYAPWRLPMSLVKLAAVRWLDL